jgi:hypothetical protein
MKATRKPEEAGKTLWTVCFHSYRLCFYLYVYPNLLSPCCPLDFSLQGTREAPQSYIILDLWVYFLCFLCSPKSSISGSTQLYELVHTRHGIKLGVPPIYQILCNCRQILCPSPRLYSGENHQAESMTGIYHTGRTGKMNRCLENR